MLAVVRVSHVAVHVYIVMCNCDELVSLLPWFSLLQSVIMSIRPGGHSSSSHPLKGRVPASVDLALKDGCLGAV